jgi:hypothetical protein
MNTRYLRTIVSVLLLFITGWFTNPQVPTIPTGNPYPSEWVHYPLWLGDWHSTLGENYAWPASLSNEHDPKWGFWFW